MYCFSFSGIDSDIVDEAIYYFKANVFFKNYEIKVRNVQSLVLKYHQSLSLCD